MKKFTALILSLVSLLFLSNDMQAEASKMPLDQHFICTSNTPVQAANEIFETLKNYILNPEGAPPGSVITLYDASKPAIVAQFKIKDLRYDSERARKLKLRSHLKKLDEFFKSCQVKDAEEAWSGQIPEVLDLITTTNDNSRIIYLLSPLYQDANEPDYNFYKDGVWTIPQPEVVLDKSSNTPFGLIGKVPLKGSVHMVYPSDQNFENGRYKIRLEQFYGHYFSKLGSKLCDFQISLEQVLLNLPNPREIERIDLVLPDDPLEHIEMRAAKDSFAGDGNADNLAKALMKMLSGNTTKGEVSIAIGSKLQGVDFDLCVWANGNTPLYFGNRTSPEGKYLKDLRTPEKHQFEEVVLNGRPETVEAYVNLHSVPEGFKDTIEGRCLILVDKVVYTSNFSFDVHRGDNGKNIDDREISPFWCKLDTSMIAVPLVKEVKDILH